MNYYYINYYHLSGLPDATTFHCFQTLFYILFTTILSNIKNILLFIYIYVIYIIND